MPRRSTLKGLPPINDAEHGFKDGYMDGVFERLRGDTNVNTSVAHSSGMKKFEEFAAEMGWVEHFIPFGKPVTALFRQLAYIDWLAHHCGLDKKTVSQYYSNLKSAPLEVLPRLGVVDSGPWGPKGVDPALVLVALHNLPSLP